MPTLSDVFSQIRFMTQVWLKSTHKPDDGFFNFHQSVVEKIARELGVEVNELANLPGETPVSMDIEAAIIQLESFFFPETSPNAELKVLLPALAEIAAKLLADEVSGDFFKTQNPIQKFYCTSLLPDKLYRQTSLGRQKVILK